MSPKTQAGVSAKGQHREASLTAAVRTARGRTVYVELTAERKAGGPSPEAIPIVRRRRQEPAAKPAQTAPAAKPAQQSRLKTPEPAPKQKPEPAPKPMPKPASQPAPGTKPQPEPVPVSRPQPAEPPAQVPTQTPTLQTQPTPVPVVSACHIEDLPTEAQLRKALDRLPASHVQDKITSLPEESLLRAELKRIHYRRQFFQTMRNVISTMITVAAASVLVAVLLLPVLRIYGASMTPTLVEGNIVASLKGSSFETGDVIAFYYNNKILVKRVIAQAGQWVNIDPDGTVYVDNVEINEPYIDQKAFGECDIELPYQVPEGRVFVMGDHREVSVDSRNTSIGCVAEEQIVGKIVFRVWPLGDFGSVE